MSTPELVTAKDILETLQEKFGIVDETWVSYYTKDAQSKNITLHEWNRVVKQVSANYSSTKALYAALEASLALFDNRIAANKTAIESEVTRATAKEAELGTAIEDEVKRAKLAEKTNADAIKTNSDNIETNATNISTNTTNIKTATDAIDTINGDATKDGSIAKAAKDTLDASKAYTDTETERAERRENEINAKVVKEISDRESADLSIREDIADYIDSTDRKLDEVESIAKGATRGIVFNDYTHLINHFNSGDLIGKYSSGTNVYILEQDVPDLWICRELPPDDWKEYIDDATILKEFFEDGGKVVQIGLYVLSTLETAKINLTEYVKTEQLEGAATLDKLSILDTGYAKSQVVLREDGVHSIGYCDVEYSENGKPKLHQISTSDYLPIVPGDNVEFVVDADKKVVRIHSKGGGGNAIIECLTLPTENISVTHFYRTPDGRVHWNDGTNWHVAIEEVNVPEYVKIRASDFNTESLAALNLPEGSRIWVSISNGIGGDVTLPSTVRELRLDYDYVQIPGTDHILNVTVPKLFTQYYPCKLTGNYNITLAKGFSEVEGSLQDDGGAAKRYEDCSNIHNLNCLLRDTEFVNCSNITNVKVLLKGTFTKCYRISNLFVGYDSVFDSCSYMSNVAIANILGVIPAETYTNCTYVDSETCMGYVSTSSRDYFEGTAAEYNTAADTVPVGAIVWLTDEEGNITTAVLDKAILGQMILGTS